VDFVNVETDPRLQYWKTVLEKKKKNYVKGGPGSNQVVGWIVEFSELKLVKCTL
jgi:hypothetical protein